MQPMEMRPQTLNTNIQVQYLLRFLLTYLKSSHDSRMQLRVCEACLRICLKLLNTWKIVSEKKLELLVPAHSLSQAIKTCLSKPGLEWKLNCHEERKAYYFKKHLFIYRKSWLKLHASLHSVVKYKFVTESVHFCIEISIWHISNLAYQYEKIIRHSNIHDNVDVIILLLV